MHIIVAGTGNSPRANTEALLGDFIDKYPDVKLVLPAFRSAFTQPQIHASQVFEDKGLDTILVTRSGQEYDYIPAYTKIMTIDEHEDILKVAVRYLKGQSEGMFILWNDDDPLSVGLLAAAKDLGVQAADLTNGLLPLVPPKDLTAIEDPIIPEEEQINEYEEDEDEDEDDIVESVEVRIEQIAKIFAKAIAKELRDYLR